MTRRACAGGLVLVALVSLLAVNTHVRGDGNGYFAWLASAVIDRDLDFRNQYRHGNALFADQFLDSDGAVQPRAVTATGHLENQWAVGPAVLWAPWFLIAHAVVSLTGQDPQDGYASVYRRACATGTVIYAWSALWLSALTAMHFGVSRSTALVSAVAVWGSSPLFVYADLLPFHVPVMAAFTVALFLWYGMTRPTIMTLGQWAIWGALAGVMGMTYYVDLVFVLALLPTRLSRTREIGWAKLLQGLLVAFASGCLAAAPQWIGKAIVYGSPFVTGYRDQFFWLSPRLWSTAFSTNHGVILWTPVVAVGVAGLAWLSRRRADVSGLVAAAAVFYVVIASYENWHGLSSFGNRFFVSWTLPLVVGVSVILDAARRRGRLPHIAMTSMLVVLVAWNAGLAFQWASKMLPSRGGVDVARVVAQQWTVPARAVSFGRRYVFDREALVRDIEEQDQQEWETYRKIR